MSDEEEDNQCPLCLEELDITEKHFKPCQCGYQICRFCWNHIVQDLNNKCPACREPYSSNYQFTPPDPQEVLKYKSKKRKDSKKKETTRKEVKNRKHLVNMRVIQRNLVYVTNISLSIAKEEILRKHEYFGQYGPIEKVVINKGNLYNVNSPHGPSVSIYVTYENKEDAINCIRSIDGYWVDNRTVRASFGTTKYCSFFLRNLTCNNSECMYLHDMGSEDDIFSKEDISQGKHHLPELNQQNLHSLNMKRAEFAKLRNTILPPARFDVPPTADTNDKDTTEAHPPLGTSPESKSLASSSGAVPVPSTTERKPKSSPWNNPPPGVSQPAPTQQSPPSVSSPSFVQVVQGSTTPPPSAPASETTSESKPEEKSILPPSASWGSKSTDKGVEAPKAQPQANNNNGNSAASPPSFNANNENQNNTKNNNTTKPADNNAPNEKREGNNEQYNNTITSTSNTTPNLFSLNEKMFEHSIFSTSPTIVDKNNTEELSSGTSWNYHSSYQASDDLLNDNWQLGSEIDDESEDEEFPFKDKDEMFMGYGFSGIKSRFQFANEEPELFPLNLSNEENQIISKFSQSQDENTKKSPTPQENTTVTESNLNFKAAEKNNNSNLFHLNNQNNLFDLDFHLNNASYNNSLGNSTLIAHNLSNSNTNININTNINNSNLMLNIKSNSPIPNNLLAGNQPSSIDSTNNTNTPVNVNAISAKLPTNSLTSNPLNSLQSSLANLSMSNNSLNPNPNSPNLNIPFDNIDKNSFVYEPDNINDKENNKMIHHILQNNSNKIHNNNNEQNTNSDEKLQKQENININNLNSNHSNSMNNSLNNNNNNNNNEEDSSHFNNNLGFPPGIDKHQAFRALLPNVNVSFNISPPVSQPEVPAQNFMFPTPFAPWNSFPTPHSAPILQPPFPLQPPRNSMPDFHYDQSNSNSNNNSFNNQSQFPPKQFPPFGSFSPFPPFALHSAGNSPLSTNHLFPPNQNSPQNQMNAPNQPSGPMGAPTSGNSNPQNAIGLNGTSLPLNNPTPTSNNSIGSMGSTSLNPSNSSTHQLPSNQLPNNSIGAPNNTNTNNNSFGPNTSPTQLQHNFSQPQMMAGSQQSQFFTPKFPQMFSSPMNQGPFLPPGIQVPTNVAPPMNHMLPNQFPHIPNQPPGFPFSHFHSVPDSNSFMENGPFMSPYPNNQYMPRTIN